MPSLSFSGSTADFARGGAPAVTAPPFTIAVLTRLGSSPAGTVAIGGLMDASSFSDSYLLRFTTSPAFRFTVRDSGVDLHVDATTTVTVNDWGWGVAIANSASDYESIWKGDLANKGASTTAKTVAAANIDRVSWGKRDHAANDQAFDGEIAAIAIWNVALDDADVTALNNGVEPDRIKRAGLVHYWQRMADTPSVHDRVGDTDLAVTGATISAEQPIRNAPFAVPIGAANFGVTVRKLSMRISDSDVWSTAAQLNFPDRPFTFIGVHDTTADEMTIYLDNGTSQTISLSGGNAQDGDLILGAGLDAGAVVDESTNELGLAGVTLLEAAADEAARERIFGQHAGWLAPVVTGTTATLAPGGATTTVDLSTFVDDKGQGWSVVSAASADERVTTELVNATTVRLTSRRNGDLDSDGEPIVVSGTDTVACAIRNQNPRPQTRILNIAVTVDATAFSNGFSYEKTVLLSQQETGEVGNDGSSSGLRQLPSPLSTGTATASTLVSVAAAAPAGRRLSLAAGNYDGLTINVPNGTAFNPVQFVPADLNNPPNLRRCIVTGNGHAIFVGITFDDRALTSSSETRSLRLSGSNKKLWFCKVSANRIGLAIEQNDPTNINIYRTDFNGQNSFTGNGDEAIKAGDQSDIARDMGLLVEECRIKDFAHGSETISVKSAGCTFRDIHIVDSRNIFTRHGNGATFERINMPGSLMNIFCQGHTIKNVTASEIRLCQGTEPASNTANGTGGSYNACASTTVQNLTGNLKVNNQPFSASWDTFANNCTWSGVSGAVTVTSGGSGNSATASSIDAETPPTYSDIDVGISAYIASLDGGSIAELSGFVARLSLTDNDLRVTGSGGNVTSADGYDITFETEAGVRLPHHVRSYTDTTGALDVHIRVPSWTPGSQSLPVRMFYGNANITTATEDPTSVWDDWLAVWDCRTGEDFSGNARTLTPSNITAGTLIGDAGDYNGTNSVAILADAGFFSGLTGCTIHGWIHPDASAIGTDKGIISQGTITGPDENMGVNIRFDAEAFHAPGTTNTWATTFNTLEGASRAEFAADIQTPDAQHFGVVFSAGDYPDLYLDGTPTVPVYTANDVTESPLATTTGGLYVGAGPKDAATGGWAGLIDELRVRGEALSSVWLQTEYWSELRRATWYGISATNTSGVTRYPVAASVYLETQEELALAVDVIARSADPENGVPNLSISAVGTPTNGAAAASGDEITYTPDAAFTGDDSFTYTITNGDKTDVGTVYVTVKGLPTAGGGGFETSTGLWQANAYADLPSEFQDAVLLTSDDNMGITQARLDSLNNVQDGSGPGPWNPSDPVYKYRRLEMRDGSAARAARDGRPSLRHKCRMVNAFGGPDTMHDLKIQAPADGNDPTEAISTPIPLDMTGYNCLLLRWHMWADAWRANTGAGKRIQLQVGFGNRGDGSKDNYLLNNYGSTAGVGFSCQSPFITGGRSGFGSLVNHITNPSNTTWTGFGESETTNRRAHALNRWVTVDQILRLNDAGQANGFWRVHSDNSHFDVVRNGVKFSNDPLTEMKAVAYETRNMHGGGPKTEANKPVNDYNEDYGGVFLFKGNWIP